METERAYMDTMRDYVKHTLKTRACVAGSQDSWGGLGGILRESGRRLCRQSRVLAAPHVSASKL